MTVFLLRLVSARIALLISVPCLLLAACPPRPEYREPPVSSPHGRLAVKPLVEGKGGGLRSIDGKLVFPRRCEPAEMPAWKYREWRIRPGTRKVELFGMGDTISRTLRVKDGGNYVFAAKKYGDSATGGNELELHLYELLEEEAGKAGE